MIVAICSLFASCMGDSYAETDENMPSPYGNNELKETNLISIANLKAKFATPINTDYRDGKSYEQITEDLQIKGIVTSSDVAGNIYNELAIQDKPSRTHWSCSKSILFKLWSTCCYHSSKYLSRANICWIGWKVQP